MPMTRQSLTVALLLAVGAVGTGVLTGVGAVTRRPDFLTAALFVVLGAATVDAFSRRSVTGRYGRTYLVALAGFAALTAVALLIGGSVVGGAVLLTVAAGAVVLQVVDTRRRRRAERADGADPPAAG